MKLMFASGSDGARGGRMFGVAQQRRRGLLVLAAVASLAVSACGGGSPTSAPSATVAGPTTTAPAASNAASGNGLAALSSASGALASLTSYKFHMTLAGTDSLNDLADLAGGASTPSADGRVAFSGTVITKPDKAADVSTSALHVIFVGGFDYMDVGNTGAFGQFQADPTSRSDPYTPASVFSKLRLNGYTRVGSETKNNVPCDHYQAGASALAEFGSVSGVKGATWTADLWIATDGGYPVGIAIVATAKDGTIPYQTTFDLSNINDEANKVTAPTNVVGA